MWLCLWQWKQNVVQFLIILFFGSTWTLPAETRLKKMKTNRPKTLSLSFTEAYIEIENYGAKKLMFLFSKVEFYSFSLLRCLSI